MNRIGRKFIPRIGLYLSGGATCETCIARPYWMNGGPPYIWSVSVSFYLFRHVVRARNRVTNVHVV